VSTVQSVERAIALLEATARQPGRLVDLAARVDLPTSTAARLLDTLEGTNALRRAADGTYRIGPLVRGMGTTTDPGIDVVTAAEPHLNDLAAELDEAACLSIVVDHDTITIRQVDAPKPVQAEDWTGTRVPLHAGSTGFVVMATWPDDRINAFLAGDLPPFTDNTVTDPTELRERIRQARTERVIWTHAEYVVGLSSCAAAILDSRGHAIGALYTYGPSYRFPPAERADAIAELILARADRVSADLGHRPTPGAAT
jgi:IclR family acetate operon transcriptional repressor